MVKPFGPVRNVPVESKQALLTAATSCAITPLSPGCAMCQFFSLLIPARLPSPFRMTGQDDRGVGHYSDCSCGSIGKIMMLLSNKTPVMPNLNTITTLIISVG